MLVIPCKDIEWLPQASSTFGLGGRDSSEIDANSLGPNVLPIFAKYTSSKLSQTDRKCFKCQGLTCFVVLCYVAAVIPTFRKIA